MTAQRERTDALRRLELSAWLLPLATLLLIALAVASIGFANPTHRTVGAANAYRHTARFSYASHIATPNTAYPSGIVQTGEPMLLNLFHRASFHVGYQFVTRLPHRITGTIALNATIVAPTSYEQTFLVHKLVAFRGDRVSVSGIVDLTAARAFIDQLSAQSGSSDADYAVSLAVTVHVTGVVAGKQLHETFSPVLPFTMNHQLLKLVVPSPSITAGSTYNAPATTALDSILTQFQSGTVPHRIVNSVSFLRLRPRVDSLRVLGIVLLAIWAALATVLGVRSSRGDARSEQDLIQARYGKLIVPSLTVNPDGHHPYEIPDFQSLARLAQHYEQLILHEHHDAHDTYAIEEGGNLYTFTIDDAPSGHRPPWVKPAARAGPTAPFPPSTHEAPAPTRRGWPLRLAARVFGVLAVLAVGAMLVTSFTASNTVPVTHVGTSFQGLSQSQVVLPECAGISIANLIVMASGASSVTGGTANDLILGRSKTGNITYTGNGGNDCIVAGGVAGTRNTLNGGSGNDVCIGASKASNSYSSCETKYTR